MSAQYAKAWADFHAEYGPDIDEAVFEAGWIMRGVAVRSAIEDAPHDLTKQHAWHGLDLTLCRCWKADVR